MKRRKFLGLFGGTIAAPLLPMAAPAAPAVYSPAALQAAMIHAKSRAVFSVWGLAKAVNVPVAQAEALMTDLAARGVLGPLQGTTFGGRWASSKILQSEALALHRVASKSQRASDQARVQSRQPDLSAMMAHLRDMADAYFARPKALT